VGHCALRFLVFVHFHPIYLFILSTLPIQYAEQGLRNGLASVRPSVCLSTRSTATAACGGFGAERPAGGDIDRWQVPALLLDGAAGSAAAVERRRSAANAGSVTLTADV